MIPPEQERVEEMSEEIWALTESGLNSYERLVNGSKIERPGDVLDGMLRDGLAVRSPGGVELSARGREIASAVVRRHRLAEMLFTQVLELREAVTEQAACEVEHILSSEVTDSVCTFLGHPTHCPHGKTIPRGRCCEILLREVSPLVSRLLDLTVGDRARIVFITPQTRKSLDRIATLGVVPGASMRLQQKSPAVVLEVGQTIVALDREIAAEIFVRRTHKEASGR
jgi:DtxR family Mn-dependent transcriptional regulator